MASKVSQIFKKVKKNLTDDEGIFKRGKLDTRQFARQAIMATPQAKQIKLVSNVARTVKDNINPNWKQDLKTTWSKPNQVIGSAIESATSFNDLKTIPDPVKKIANFAGSGARGAYSGTTSGATLGLVRPEIKDQGGLYKPAQSLSQAISSTLPLSKIGAGASKLVGKPISSTVLQGQALKTALSPKFIGAQTAFGSLIGGGAKMLDNAQNQKPISEGVFKSALDQGKESMYRAPSMGAMVGLTNPAIEYAGKYLQSSQIFQKLNPTAKAQILDRLAGSTMNVLEGIGLDKTQGYKTDKTSIGVDAGTGLLMGTQGVKGLNDPIKKSLRENVDFLLKNIKNEDGFVRIGGNSIADSIKNNIYLEEKKYKGKDVGGILRLKDGVLKYSIDDNKFIIDEVEVKSQKKGTGTDLMEAVEGLAKKKGFNEIELNAYPQNDTIKSDDLINFYEKLGYNTNEVMEMFGETSADMSKDLSLTTPKNIPSKDDLLKYFKSTGYQKEAPLEGVAPPKYKNSYNLKNPDDVEYLSRIFSKDQIENFKKGNFEHWRGGGKEYFEKMLNGHILNEKYTKPKLKYAPMGQNEIESVFHGTAIENLPSIENKGLLPGGKAPNAELGGGYGNIQNTISTSLDQNTASRFTGSSKKGAVLRLDVSDKAKIVKASVDDAVDIEPHLQQLKKEKVDAVYIGGGEKELVVLNPNILTPRAKKIFDVYKNGGNINHIPEESYGLIAGFEPQYDEDGNFIGIKYNPNKGMIGLALTAGYKNKNIRNAIGNTKIKLTPEQTKAKGKLGDIMYETRQEKLFGKNPDLLPWETENTKYQKEAPLEGVAPPKSPPSKTGGMGTENSNPQVFNDILQKWRNKTLLGKQEADIQAQKLQGISEKDGLKIIKFIENPTQANAQKLQLNPTEYKTQIQEIKSFYKNIREEGLRRGLDIGELDNYINHTWQESPKEIFDLIEQKTKGIGKNPSFTKKRKMPSYEEGINLGLTPKFIHPAQLMGHYRAQLEKATAAKELVKDLFNSGIVQKVDGAPIGWKPIDAPLVPDLNGKFAPKNMADTLSNIFGQGRDDALSKIVSGASQVSKTMQDVTLSGGIRTLNSFSLGNLVKEYHALRFKDPTTAFIRSFSNSSSRKYFNENQEVLKEMARNGNPISTNLDYNKIYKNISEKSGPVSWFKNIWDSNINAPTFERFLPMLQVEFYKSARKQGMDERQATEAVKNFYGVIDNFKGAKFTEDALSAVFFAPKFRESMINFWGKNLNSIGIEGKKGKIPIKLNPKNLTDPTLGMNRRFLAGTVLIYALMQVANKQISGHWAHENKEGKEFALEIPRGNGKSWYIPLLPTIATIPRRILEGGSALLHGDVKQAGQKAGSFFSQPISLASQLATNQTYYGGDIYNKDDSTLKKYGKLGGYALSQSMHPFIGEPIEMAQGRKTPLEGTMGMLELPVYPSKSTGFEDLSYAKIDEYNRLKEQNPALAESFKAQEIEKKQPKEKVSEYVTEEDSPTTKLGKAGLYAKSAIANPIQTYEAVKNDEPIRKLRLSGGGPGGFFDSTTVTERKKGVGDLDQGDKATEVDHKIPKWIGGREKDDNYQILTNEEHKYKSAQEKILRDKYEAGKISRKEALEGIDKINSKLHPIEIPKEVTVTSIDKNGNTKSKSLNIQEVVDLPTNTPSQKTIKEKKAYSLVDDIVESNLSSNEKAAMWKTLGLNEDNVRYYINSSKTNDEKYSIVSDAISRIEDHDKIIDYLKEGRLNINNTYLASNGVLDYLEQDGVISDAENKWLKKLKYYTEVDDNGNIKLILGSNKKSSGRKKKLKLGTTKKLRIANRVGGSKTKLPPIKISLGGNPTPPISTQKQSIKIKQPKKIDVTTLMNQYKNIV